MEQRSTPRRELAYKLAIGITVCALTARFLSVYGDYPYYFIWDMDLVVTLDSILIHSGFLPDHLNHTAFGMNLLLAFSEKIARAYDVLSVLTLEDLSRSLNPVVGVAELTNFIRLHSPFVAIGITLALWGAICLLLRPSRLWSLFLLVMLGTQESLVYHSAMVRTEFYSMLFWSGGILVLSIALHARSWQRVSMHLFFAGILMGLCFLTKLQALFYVGTFPLFLLLGLSCVSEKPVEARRWPVFTMGASLFNALFFSALLLAAAAATLPEGMGVFYYEAGELDLAPYALVLLVVLWALFAAQCILHRRSQTMSASFRNLGLMTYVLSGFHFAFLLHFLMFPDPGRSLDYLLYDSKMLFFRGTYLDTASLSGYVSNLKSLFLYNPTVVLSHVASLLLLIAGYFGRFISLSKRQLLFLGLLSGVALVQLALGTRWILRDVLFLEILLNTLTLIYLTLALTRAARWPRFVATLSAVGLLLLVGSNLQHGASMTSRIDANFTHYGWWESRWFTSVYRANHLKYRDLMERHYRGADAVAVMAARRQARRHREIRRTASFVFKNQTITLRNIGVLWEGLPVWVAEPDWILERVPEDLRNAIVVDSPSIQTGRRYAFQEDAVTTHSESMDKLTRASPGHLVVLKRRDLRIYLFAPTENLHNLKGPHFSRDRARTVTLKNGERTLELDGIEIANYVELPLEALGHRFFFVIRRV